MKRLLAISFALILTMDPAQLLAKADTCRITIKGAGVEAPIEITDTTVLRDFRVWSGPGTSSSDGRAPEPQSFIVDWARGSIAAPPQGLARFELSFYSKYPCDNKNLNERWSTSSSTLTILGRGKGTCTCPARQKIGINSM